MTVWGSRGRCCIIYDHSLFFNSTHLSSFLLFTVNFFVEIYSKTRLERRERDGAIDEDSVLNAKRSKMPIEKRRLSSEFGDVTRLS